MNSQSNTSNAKLSSSSSRASMNDEQQFQQSYTFRIVTCGQPSVGKTSLLKRLTKNSFNPNEPSTVGSEYIHFDYSDPESNQEVHLQIWDTAGEEKYRSLAPLYFRNSNGALLVFDQTSKNTFESLNDWINIYKDTNGDDALFFVIANKSDLIMNQNSNKSVKFSMAQNVNTNECQNSSCDYSTFCEEALYWARCKGYPFFETSAKTGEGVENLLSAIIQSFIEKVKNSNKKHFTLRKPSLKNEDRNNSEKCSC